MTWTIPTYDQWGPTPSGYEPEEWDVVRDDGLRLITSTTILDADTQVAWLNARGGRGDRVDPCASCRFVRDVAVQERPEGERAGRGRRLRELHAEGFTDQEIADDLGMTRESVSRLRRRLGLPVNRVIRSRRSWAPAEPRHDYRPDVARLHGECLTDAEIAERLDLSSSYVATLRRQLELTPNRSVRTKWDDADLQPHGTNACYARGCREPECVAAHRQYHRDYAKRRRQEGAREHHGTAYGYQLGCKDRAGCPATPTCADASLAAEAARRRAAGIPPKTLVDAALVQAHIRDLTHAGIPLARVAEQAGLTFSIVRKMVHSRGKGRGLVATVLADRAAAVLSVPLPGGRA